MPRRPIDLIGNQYGRLTVVSLFRGPIKRANKSAQWNCRCTCGNVTSVAAHYLKNGSTRSCGCLRRENGRRTIGEYNDRHKP